MPIPIEPVAKPVVEHARLNLHQCDSVGRQHFSPSLVDDGRTVWPLLADLLDGNHFRACEVQAQLDIIAILDYQN